MNPFSSSSRLLQAPGARLAASLGLLVVLGVTASACRDELPEALGGPNLAPEPLAEERVPHGYADLRGASLPAGVHDAASPPSGSVDPHETLRQEADECRARVEEALLQPALPGAPRLEERRAQVLGRGKAEPVLFVEEPEFTGEVSKGIAAHRRRIVQTFFPRDVLLGHLTHFDGILPQLRQLLLRNGYFYTDDPAAARALTHRVGFEDLFREERLVVQRGSRTFPIERKEGLYYHAEGDAQGERARLLLFDRVWIEGEDPGPALHVDVRELARREGFRQMSVNHIGERHIVAQLRFSDEWVLALIERSGVELSLDCLLVEPEDAARIGRARDAAFRRATVLHALREVIAEQVRAGLPFDEPRTEVGQQDGKLRKQWEYAYFRGRTSYRFNGDRYRVFDDRGHPMTPQVCIDFITESMERASGMHFADEGRSPEQVRGAIDFDDILGAERRRELALRNYARLNPERFELLDYPMGAWVRYEKVPQFFEFVERERENLQAGDIVVIRGRAAWDRYEHVHTHTFFVYESDPITGMPTLLAGNSGKPRVVTWDDEMLRAPKRSIRHRLRPNMEWLYDNVVIRPPRQGERWAAPLVVREN